MRGAPDEPQEARSSPTRVARPKSSPYSDRRATERHITGSGPIHVAKDDNRRDQRCPEKEGGHRANFAPREVVVTSRPGSDLASTAWRFRRLVRREEHSRDSWRRCNTRRVFRPIGGHGAAAAHGDFFQMLQLSAAGRSQEARALLDHVRTVYGPALTVGLETVFNNLDAARVFHSNFNVTSGRYLEEPKRLIDHLRVTLPALLGETSHGP